MNPILVNAIATKVVGTIRYKSPEQRDREKRAARIHCVRHRVVRVLRTLRRWIRSLPRSRDGGAK